MAETPIADLDWTRVPAPAFVVDSRLLERNARILQRVRVEAGCRVLLALKGFAMWPAFRHIAPFLDGASASGPIEAQLAREEFAPLCGDTPGEVHTYAPAFSDDDLQESLPLSDHLVFNSPSQVERHLPAVRAFTARTGQHIGVGLRINPEYAEVEVDLYNPCAPGSRLGTTRTVLGDTLPDGVDGLHFHALCEQGADVLVRVLAHVEERFGDLFPHIRWLNLGGGHWITKPDYDVDLLVNTLRDLRRRYPHLTLYLEPGEAAAVDTGVLVATVLDIHESGVPLALLDVSATCHMPDVLEMPYRPTIHGAGDPGLHPHTYRLGGPTCLAGDVIGEWSFARPLQPGDRVVFADMAHYTMVKTTMFNGVKHPALCLWNGENLTVARRFGYADFRARLG
ncbi:MAG: carboxynorspermidine decarboxylase [Deltaproteobacteria bacterium]|nr:MAG: carboxynorspermidine decarboxylase [Deltaproteobacteria bacterium]